MPLRRALVIPAFNESPRLQAGFDRLAPLLETWNGDETEIVFVDDGSTDDTLASIARVYGGVANLKVIQHEQNLGKGAAVRTGWASAKSPHVITVDADMGIRPEHLPAIDNALNNVDVAAGSRATNGAIAYDSRLRTWGSTFFHTMTERAIGKVERDTQCGCKGMRLEVARLLGLFGMIPGFAYDAELFFLARQFELSVTSVPVTWDDVSGSSVSLGHARRILRDIRDIPSTRYENPAIRLPRACDVSDVRASAISVRQRGLVLARGVDDALVVLPRDAGLNAIAMAQQLGGALTMVQPADLRGAELAAV